MRTRRVALAFTIASVLSQNAAFSQTPQLRPPRTAIGFRTVPVEGWQRPMSVWYPATPVAGAAALTTEDYLTASVDTVARARSMFMTGIARSWGGANGIPSGPRPPDLPDSVAQRTLSLRARAVRDAAPSGGQYPLVVFSIPLGGTGAVDGFLLAEELAGQGSVVVSGPPLGSVPDGIGMEDYLDVLAAEARRLLPASLALPNVDRRRVFMLDPTGVTALVLQLERPLLAGAIAFDEMPFPERQRQTITKGASRLRFDVLYVPLGSPAPNGEVFRSLTGSRVTTLEIPGAAHGLMSPWRAYFHRSLRGAAPNYDLALGRIMDFVSGVRRQ